MYTRAITEVHKEYGEGTKKRAVNSIWELQENIYRGGVKLRLRRQNRDCRRFHTEGGAGARIQS